MREFITESSSATYRVTFNRILASIPVPGTPSFGFLCRDLQPYGISPSGVTLEAPTARLSDVNLSISLLEDRALLRIFYDGFELIFSSLHEQSKNSAGDNIIGLLFAALREIDPDVTQGRARISWQGHLAFSSPDVDGFLREHLHGGETAISLMADAFAYKFQWDDSTSIQVPRIVVARSLLFANAIFVDFSVEYGSPAEPARNTEQFSKDTLRALTELGLKPKTTPAGANSI